MTENDYTLAWGLYACAALGCLLVGFKITGWMWRWLREPLRVIIAVLLLTPTIVDPVKGMFAPAIAITALDVAFKVGDNVWRAASDLAMYGLIAFGLYLLFVLVRWPLEKNARERREKADLEARRQAQDDERMIADTPAADPRDRYRAEPPVAPVRRPGAGGGRVEPRV